MVQSNGYEATRGNTFGCGALTTIVATNEGCFEIIAKQRRVRLLSLEIHMVAATASVFVLGRPAAAGVTPTEQLFQSLMSGGADRQSTATFAVAWGGARPTPPTVPIAAFVQLSAIGNFKRMDFDDLWIPTGKTLALVNFGATGTQRITAVIEELPY